MDIENIRKRCYKETNSATYIRFNTTADCHRRSDHHIQYYTIGFQNKKPSLVTWCDEHDRPHRDDDKPAIYKFRINWGLYGSWTPKPRCGKYFREFIWCNHGETHRENDKPAIVRWHYRLKHIHSEEYFCHDEFHRENDKPAIVEYDSLGRIAFEAWYTHGKLHRLTGPARIYYKRGFITRREWFINGEQKKRKDIEKLIGKKLDKKLEVSDQITLKMSLS